jgi:hypothetical protein
MEKNSDRGGADDENTAQLKDPVYLQVQEPEMQVLVKVVKAGGTKEDEAEKKKQPDESEPEALAQVPQGIDEPCEAGQ